MKILAQLIEVLAHFKISGTPHPQRLTHNNKEYKVQHVTSMTEEKLADNRMLLFRCQSEIGGELRSFEFKYEPKVCKWYLWKM